MVQCAVVGCSSNNNKRCKTASTCRYFTFPSSKETCSLWVKNCFQKNKFNVKTARICSKHFSDDDYRLQEKLLKLPIQKWKLKDDAIPSLNIPIQSMNPTVTQKKREKRIEKRSLMKNMFDIQQEHDSADGSSNGRTMVMDIDNESSTVVEVQTSSTHSAVWGAVNMATQTTSSNEQSDLLEQIRVLQNENILLKEQLRNEKEGSRSVEEIFTEGQCKLKTKKQIRSTNMPTQCAVFGCSNSSHKTSSADVKISYHSFPRPKDLASSLLREEWICRCGRGKKTFNPNTSRICSAHFGEDDYERDLKNELLGLPLKRILKKDAIPTLKLSYNTSEELSITANENIEVITLDVIDDTETLPEQTNGQLYHEIDPIPTRNPMEEYQDINYKVKYEELLEKYKSLKTTSSKKIRALNSQLIYFKKKAYNIKKPSKSEETASTLLKMLLTKNQINLLSKRKKRVNWNSEEIAMAFTLRHYSRKCYLYLRNVLHYPLPTLSSLKKWALKIDIIQSDETYIQGESNGDIQVRPSILAEP